MEAASNSELILTTPVIVFFAAPAIAVPLALLVSLGLLRIYRRAVMRSMQWRGTPGAAVGMMAVLENSPARSGESSRHSLEITPHDPPADGTRLAVRRTMWASAAVQVCAGLSYAMFIASWWLVAVDRGFDWLVFLTMSVWFGWPMVITVGLAVTVSWRGFAMLVVGYVLALAGLGALMFVNTDITARPLLTNWLYTNGIGTLLALAFLARPIRAVGLLVLVFMIAAVGGAIFVLLYYDQHRQALYWVYLGIFYGAEPLLLACAIATGILCWLLLRWLVTGVTASQQLTNWLNANVADRIRALTLARPISAVIVLLMIAAIAGAIVIQDLFGDSVEQRTLQSFVEQRTFLYWVYLGIFYGAELLLLACAIATGILCWLLLRWLVTGVTASQQLTNWLNANVADRIRALTLARLISAVIVLLMIAAIAGAIVIQDLFGDSVEQRTLLWLIISKLGVTGNVVLLLLVGIVPAGIIGWLLLRWLGSLYRARRISDQSIMIDAVWLMFSFLQSPAYASMNLEGMGAIAIGAFVAYKVVATAGFRFLRTGAEKDAQGSKLLLLRVFSLGTRSERLFASFTKLWRHMGSVRMIAGPDLATSTVEPHEFLDFLAGRLQRRFINGPDALEQRLRESEQRRDVDGRFRIADFFCHDDTWQMVLKRLAKDSDVVLMDLRGFSQSNRGCVFEINELLDVVLLRHIVFVVDHTTDERFLVQVFADAWAMLTNASPNWNDPTPRVRLYHFDDQLRQNIPALVAVAANAGMHFPMRN